MNESTKADVLKQIAEQAVPTTLDLWPAISERVASTAQSRPASDYNGATAKRWRRRSVVGLATAAMLAIAVGATFPLWNRPQSVDAQAILDRAQATADGSSPAVTTYHLQLTREVPGKGNATISAEQWYGGKDRQRSEQQMRDASGAVVSGGVVFNGAQAWMFSTENGQTRVVHTTGTSWNKLDDPAPRTSLADALAQYSNDKSCMVAKQQGEATVANRATYVIVATPRPDGCASTRGGAAPAKQTEVRQANVGQRVAPDNQIGQMTVWVDEQSFLPLRMEIRNGAGAVIDRSEVTSVQYNVPIADSVFSYSPPAGATVSNFTGGDGADVKRAMFGGSTSAPKPTSTP